LYTAEIDAPSYDLNDVIPTKGWNWKGKVDANYGSDLLYKLKNVGGTGGHIDTRKNNIIEECVINHISIKNKGVVVAETDQITTKMKILREGRSQLVNATP